MRKPLAAVTGLILGERSDRSRLRIAGGLTADKWHRIVATMLHLMIPVSFYWTCAT